MAAATNKEVHLEIAHVLFVDTVGYSKLSTSEQHESLETLNQLVRATDRFRAAEAAGDLVRLPTGDGMALVFCDDPESPIQCALEICAALREHPQLKLRMGIHSGPVSRVVDVNDHSNIAGAGVNMAERIMTCGDAGHILISKRAAEDLAEFPRWRPHLNPLGECAGKHGARLEIVNFYTEEFGNPETPAIFKQQAQQVPGKFRAVTALWPFLATGALLVALAVFFLSLFSSHEPRPATTNHLVPPAAAAPAAIPEKSIAVLPFENLSDEKENEYFADGVQDEIRNALAKVADLKVISRTSVMQYRTGPKRDLREIASSLGVAHVLEGSVQRADGQVRVSARLVDARVDKNLWAQHYDRKMTGVFALQSEIAEEIVAQLQAKLSPDEKAAIEEPPTANLAAYDLYVKAKAIGATLTFSGRSKQNLSEAVSLLDKAVQLDPQFLLARCLLARTHDQAYLLGIDHTPERLALADKAVRTALRLRPDSGPAHLAAAFHFYAGLRDYDRARAELAMAEKVLPNEPLIFEIAGYIDRRQGRYAESIAAMQRALELDPQNLILLQQIAISYESLRRYPEMAAILDRALTLAPQDDGTRLARAFIELTWHANPKPAHEEINRILVAQPEAATDLAAGWFSVALCERDPVATQRALSAMPPGGCRQQGLPFPDAWCRGLAADLRGDTEAVHAAMSEARSEVEEIVTEIPDYPEALCVLGVIDAALGRKEEAIREGRRAVELLPVSKDSINGELLIEYLAMIYAWTGEQDLAVEQLAIAVGMPGQLSYGDLRLNPSWDSLRGDPGFEKLVASLAPTDAKATNAH
ncbi:MAG: tetratricopeptide repeat protein [Chthoniobacterales bacterium]|nr:tetratricopeptide repeat protein [Chthoniobacterales bacterium]